MARTIRRNRKTGRPERDSYHRSTHAAASCRHHGGCEWCEGNRTVTDQRAGIAAADALMGIFGYKRVNIEEQE